MPICTVEEANALIESSLSSTVDAQQRKPRPLNTHTRFGDKRAEWAEGNTVLGDAGRNPSSSSTAADKVFEPMSTAVEGVCSTMVLLEDTDALHGSSDESSVGGASCSTTVPHEGSSSPKAAETTASPQPDMATPASTVAAEPSTTDAGSPAPPPTPSTALVIPVHYPISPRPPPAGCVDCGDGKYRISSVFDGPTPDPENRSTQKTKDGYYPIYNGLADDGTLNWIGIAGSWQAAKERTQGAKGVLFSKRDTLYEAQ